MFCCISHADKHSLFFSELLLPKLAGSTDTCTVKWIDWSSNQKTEGMTFSAIASKVCHLPKCSLVSI
jgi:hypothetical protein